MTPFSRGSKLAVDIVRSLARDPARTLHLLENLPFALRGLQMAERALSGELGYTCDSINPAACADAGLPFAVYSPDREKDCVPEISAVQLPSALANQITFQIGN